MSVWTETRQGYQLLLLIFHTVLDVLNQHGESRKGFLLETYPYLQMMWLSTPKISRNLPKTPVTEQGHMLTGHKTNIFKIKCIPVL